MPAGSLENYRAEPTLGLYDRGGELGFDRGGKRRDFNIACNGGLVYGCMSIMYFSGEEREHAKYDCPYE